MVKINILSINYTIIYNDFVCKTGDMGEADFISKTMTIYKHGNKQEQNKTLLHEIIECMNHEFLIRLKHEQIEKLEDAIYDTFKRNEIKEIFE